LFKIANLGAGIIRERIRKYNIDADFVPGYGYLAYTSEPTTCCTSFPVYSSISSSGVAALNSFSHWRSVYCGALKHMGGGQIHSLNMLLGSAQAAHSLGVKIFGPAFCCRSPAPYC
jgi:gamma-glutamylputrescine oxidase